MNKPEKLEIENVQLMGGRFKNFSGRATKYNREGDRFINVRIPSQEQAEELAEEGWNIKILDPKEEGDEPVYYLTVKIRYKVEGGKKDPNIFKGISSDNMHRLTPENTGDLDRDEVERADIVINPSYYNTNGKEGYSAYLDSLYVIIKGNRFASKYTVVDDEPIAESEEDEEEE